MSKHICAVTTVLVLGLFGSMGRADTVLNSVARGYYDQAGLHPAGDNYIAGQSGNETYHDFFTFNLSGVSGTIVGATLVLYNPPGGTNGSGIYTVYDVSTDAATLNTERIAGATAPNNPNVNIFNDLGSGNAYGMLSYNTSDNGKTVTINLDSQFLSDINSRSSSLFSVGGFADTGPFLYGFSGSGNAADGLTRIDLVVATPLPSSAAGLVALAAVLGLWKFHQRFAGVAN
jgi:hypothetical protein